MARRPSEASTAVSFPLLFSFVDESYHLPRLLPGSSLTVGICLLDNVNVVAVSILPFLTERLRDFFGFKFILHRDIKPSRCSNILRVSASFEQITVVSFMNAFRGGM